VQSSDLNRLIQEFAELVHNAGSKGFDWKHAWGEVKSIQQSFKDTRYHSRDEHQSAWNDFQGIVKQLKAAGDLSHQQSAERREFTRLSESHLEKLKRLADRARTPSGLDNFIIAVATGGLSVMIEAGIDALIGESDKQKEELSSRSNYLKSARAYLSDNKADMSGFHKQAGFTYLQEVQAELDRDWQRWKSHRDGIYQERRQKYEERREAAARKKQVWQERQEEFIDRLESAIERKSDFIDKQRAHLRELKNRRDESRSDSYRERVDGWIAEGQYKVEEATEQLEEMVEKLRDARAKLRD
jgi:uncharacterized coiled-coil protein SlyX